MKKKFLAFALGASLIIPCMTMATGCGKKEQDPNGPIVDVWDGKTITLSEAVNDIITIETAEELAGFAAAINAGENFKGITVELTCDMDLNNIEWTPAGYGITDVASDAVKNDSTVFSGTFDGKGHTISNLKLTEFDTMREGTGFFGNLSRATIKNVKINGAEVLGYHYVGTLAGIARASVIDNCHIEDAQVSCVYDDVAEDNGDKAGGLVGYASFSRKVDEQADTIVKNSSVKNSTVNAVRDAGQLIGCADTGVVKMMENNSATNVVVTANNSADGTGEAGKKGQNIRNDIYGRLDAVAKMNWREYGASAAQAIRDLPTPTQEVIAGETWDVYEISNPAQLAGLAQAVNEGNEFATSKFLLTQDLDLGGWDWTPIGYGYATSSIFGKAFKGVFDGQGNTIYNYQLNYANKNLGGEDTGSGGIGLFGLVIGGRIENLTVYGVTYNTKANGIKGTANHWAGALVGYMDTGATVANCHAVNATIVCAYKDSNDTGDKAGALIGASFGEEDAPEVIKNQIINCSATNCTVSAVRDAGQLVGHAEYTYFENNSATNVTVSGNDTCPSDYSRKGENIKNEIVGRQDGLNYGLED